MLAARLLSLGHVVIGPGVRPPPAAKTAGKRMLALDKWSVVIRVVEHARERSRGRAGEDGQLEEEHRRWRGPEWRGASGECLLQRAVSRNQGGRFKGDPEDGMLDR